MSGIKINTNTQSLQAQRRLSEATLSLSQSFERLSSGLRINRASDDAAGLSIAQSLQADARIYTQAIRNVNDGLSLLSIAEGALHELATIAIRQRELATQAANGSYSLQQRRALNAEANTLVGEYNRIVAATEFNGMKLLDGPSGEVRIQCGYGPEGSIGFILGEELSRTVGDGTFGAPATLASPSTWGAVEMGDFDSDGNLDLVASNEAGYVNLFLGNGDGTFGSMTSFQPGGASELELTGVDINRDGDLDVLVARQGYGFAVLLGNGNGTFQAGQNFRAPANDSRNFSVADFDRDGQLDVALTNYAARAVSVFLGNGNGSFAAATSYATFQNPRDIVSADFNGDSVPDLAINEYVSGTTLLLGRGDGTFNPAYSIAAGGFGSLLVTGDFDKDGCADLASPGSGFVVVQLGNGNGTFKNETYPSIIGGWGIAAADLTGDGHTDFAVTSSFNGSLGILLGNGNGTFAVTSSIGLAGNSWTAAIGDLNSDGAPDLAASSPNILNIMLAHTHALPTELPLNLTSAAGAREAMPLLDDTLDRISRELGAIGSIQSRLGVALNNLAVGRENISAAASRIIDADVAQESADLVRKQILAQGCAAVLSQANQQPALALKLLV